MEEVISLMQRPDDSAVAAAVRPQGYILALARPSGLADDGEEGDQAVLGDGNQAADSVDGYEVSCDCAQCQREPESEEKSGDDGDGEEFYDSDDDSYYSYYEERDGEVNVPLKIEDGGQADEASGVGGPQSPLVRSRVVVPEGRFLGPRCFASAGSTAGFMRVAVVEPPAGIQEEEGGKQITVLYRYTHFWAASDGGDGLEVCGSTKLHQLRFVVPHAGDAASSLPWAGSSLAPLIYPAHQRKELQALWSRLVSEVAVPPRATRVQVIADVGILRREDRTRRRMESVRAALKDMMDEDEAWPGYHVAMELQLPEPVDLCVDEDEAADGEEDTGCKRPAKRRKVVAEAAREECSVCFELLESDLAVWPGCSLPHVFHGTCLEHTLKGSEMCPLCRRKLSAVDEERGAPDDR
ncbi:hypothetical protein ACQ4PT_060487 [Festuca glaucescens]